MKKVYFILISALILSQSIAAQPDSIKIKVPMLSGHTFSSFNQFRSSFVNTSLIANMGFGSTSTLKIPGFEIGESELFTFEGKLAFFDMNVRYQQRFRPWLAMFFSFKLAGRVGTDVSTILVNGVNTISGGDIGWLARIYESEKFYLSSSLTLSNLRGNFINVRQYFEDLINDSIDPQVIYNIPATAIGVGLYGAYAINQTIGLQFQTEFYYGESFVRGLNKGYINGGIMVDFDFNPKYNVPINFGLGYNLSSEPEIVLEGGKISNLFTTKIGYSGASDFELGIQFSYYDVVIENVEGNPYVGKIILLLKFYF
jgi:hypothetical protein